MKKAALIRTAVLLFGIALFHVHSSEGPSGDLVQPQEKHSFTLDEKESRDKQGFT
ncbi:hypothetical protein [Bacillus sp. JCM 19041]|uniref:hypothetical protein n=1 Tax=Bacillus sp. JCM 19041 TaxID=1460637 RepID=UPI000A4A2085